MMKGFPFNTQILDIDPLFTMAFFRSSGPVFIPKKHTKSSYRSQQRAKSKQRFRNKK